MTKPDRVEFDSLYRKWNRKIHRERLLRRSRVERLAHDRWYSPRDLSPIFGMEVSSVRYWLYGAVERGELEAKKVPGRTAPETRVRRIRRAVPSD